LIRGPAVGVGLLTDSDMIRDLRLLGDLPLAYKHLVRATHLPTLQSLGAPAAARVPAAPLSPTDFASFSVSCLILRVPTAALPKAGVPCIGLLHCYTKILEW